MSLATAANSTGWMDNTSRETKRRDDNGFCEEIADGYEQVR
jgi:hypothetical protein